MAIREVENNNIRKQTALERLANKFRLYWTEHKTFIIIFTVVVFVIAAGMSGMMIKSVANLAGRKKNLPALLYGIITPFPYVLVCIAHIIAFIARMNMRERDVDLERNFEYSQSGVAGTARFMNEEEKLNTFNFNDIEDTTENIVGYNIDRDGNITDSVLSPKAENFLNGHKFICGGSGTRKTTTQLLNDAFQDIRRGESIICSDPKGELYKYLSVLLRNEGYDVKQFNLKSPDCSDGIDILSECRSADGNRTETVTNVQIIAKTIMDNTGGGSHQKKDFWYEQGLSILTGCMLYEVFKSRTTTFDDVYADIQKNPKDIGELFKDLPPNSEARNEINPFLTYIETGKIDIAAQALNGLRGRLQVFVNNAVLKAVSTPEMDLAKPGHAKCAYFVISSDQHDAMEFVMATFFSLFFIKIIAYADSRPDEECEVRVNLLLDEFPSIGIIRNIEKKLATVRSRRVSITMVAQDVGQMERLYPEKMWATIMANCDINTYLGGNDSEDTAAYYIKRLGEATVISESTRHNRSKADPFRDNLHMAEMLNESTSSRKLLTVDEFLRLDTDQSLVFLKAKNPVKVGKFVYTGNPLAKRIEKLSPLMHIPAWKREECGYPADMPDEQLAPIHYDIVARKVRGEVLTFEEYMKAKEDGTLKEIDTDAPIVEDDYEVGANPAPAPNSPRNPNKPRGGLPFGGGTLPASPTQPASPPQGKPEPSKPEPSKPSGGSPAPENNENPKAENPTPLTPPEPVRPKHKAVNLDGIAKAAGKGDNTSQKPPKPNTPAAPEKTEEKGEEKEPSNTSPESPNKSQENKTIDSRKKKPLNSPKGLLSTLKGNKVATLNNTKNAKN